MSPGKLALGDRLFLKLAIQQHEGLVAIFQDKDSRHGETMNLDVMLTFVRDATRGLDTT